MRTNHRRQWGGRILLPIAVANCYFLTCYGATSTLAVSSATATPGATTSFTLSFASGTGTAAAVQWTLNLPPAIASFAVQPGPAASAAGKTLSCNSRICIVAGLNSTPIGSGVVATITATVATTASGSSAVQVTNLSEAESDGSAGSITGVGGSLTVNKTPTVGISVTPSSVTLSGGQTAQFTATVTGTSNTGVNWSLNPGVGSLASGTYTAPASIASAQTVTVTATSVADTTKSASATISLTPTSSPASSSDVSIWPDSKTPSTSFVPDKPVEVGVKFRSDIAGAITGIRFYKGSGNTGAHTGSLWTSTGKLLATGAFTSETATGWQRMTFATPVPITAQTTYIASYHTDAGYAIDQSYFIGHSADNAPLHGLQYGTEGGNGVYLYGPGGQCPAASAGNNYWVDVTFNSGNSGSSPAPAPSTGISIWPDSTTPAVPFYADNPIEVGVKFRSDVDGTITGIRFYKGAGNTGPHTGSLWSSTGALLATGAFTSETASGWQQMTFTTPVEITAQVTYIASYHSNTGYAVDAAYFTSHGANGPPLHALQYGAEGGDGVYLYGSGGHCPSASAGNNYWVDVVFSPSK